ncbi:MAG: hypothetical protein R3C44_02975 [Chloroflexota bacterium]
MDTGKQDETWPIEIIRSKRRRKTVGARLEKGVLVIRAPAELTDDELAPIIEQLRVRMARRQRPKPPVTLTWKSEPES